MNKWKIRVLAGVVTCGCALWAGAVTDPPEHITVVKVYREAECLQAGEEEWKPAAMGEKLKAKDSLKTLNNSYADMQLDPQNRFRLRENSVLDIERLGHEARDPDGSVVKIVDLGLLEGELLARLDRLPVGTRLNIRSPVAIAAVRGTTFAMGIGSDTRTTRVAVSNGRLTVKAIGEPQKFVPVDAQQHTVVSPWGKAILRARGTGLPPKSLLIKRLGDPKVPIKDAREMLERLRKPRPSLKNIVISASASATAPAGIEDREEARRLASEKARSRARKEIIRKLEMVRLSGEETIGDVMNKDAGICRSLFELTLRTGAVEQYDVKTRTSTVQLSLPLEPVRTVIGRDISFAWTKISPVSLKDYAAAFGGFIRAATARAAQVDAYRRLAENIYGTVVNSTTTLRDFTVRNDKIEIAVKGVVRGAGEVSRTYYSDGSIDIVLDISGSTVTSGLSPVTGDIFGKNYMASPVALSADDFIELLQAGEL